MLLDTIVVVVERLVAPAGIVLQVAKCVIVAIPL